MSQPSLYGTVDSYNPKKNKPYYTFLLTHRNDEPSFTDKDGKPIQIAMFPNSRGLKLQDEIYDKSKGLMRMIRVVSGETSIYADEQERYKTTELHKVPVKRVSFVRGELVVDARDKQTLEFLRLSKHNMKNTDPGKPHIYLEFDNDIGLQVAMDEERSRIKAELWCMEADWNRVEAYARFMQLPVERNSPEDIRFRLKDIAKKDPKKFMEGLDSPLLDIHYWISKGVDHGVIKLDPATLVIRWASGGPIIACPAGTQNMINHLVEEMVKPTGVGQQILFEVKRAIGIKESPANKKQEVPTELTAESLPKGPLGALAPDEVSQITSSKPNPEELTPDAFIKACEDAGIIIRNVGKYTLVSPKNDAVPAASVTGKAKVVEFLKTPEGREWYKWAYGKLKEVHVPEVDKVETDEFPG